MDGLLSSVCYTILRAERKYFNSKNRFLKMTKINFTFQQSIEKILVFEECSYHVYCTILIYPESPGHLS